MTFGILIDIEGGDGAGKATQTELLRKRLEEAGQRVTMFDFPRYYDSRVGRLIGELLSGKHGDFMVMPAQVTSLPYMLDRAAAKSDILAALTDGGIAICNRYTPSNLAHQSAKVPKDEQAALVELIEGIEYGDLGVPQPDTVMYLAVPTDISSDLIAKKSKRDYLGDEHGGRDLAERNITHQDRARAAYVRLAAEKSWHVVECATGGALRTPEDIHTEIWEIVQARLAR